MRRIIYTNKPDTNPIKKKNEDINKDGYKVNQAGKLIHRVISEETDGKIKSGWHVHHCDFNKLNNKIENLVQIPAELHNEMHCF